MKVMRNLPKKKGYAKHLEVLGDELYAVEHTRGDNCNAAVVILNDGRYYVGLSRCNPIDQYNHKLGHEIAVGRALFAATSLVPSDGKLWNPGDTPLTGRDLGKVCRSIAFQNLLEDPRL